MKNLFKIVLSAVILLSSCKKDYLDTVPTNSTGMATAFATTENAALAVNGLAKLMTRQFLGSQGFNGEGTIKMWYGNFQGNNFYVNQTSMATMINGNYFDNTSVSYDYYPWFYYYYLITNANTIILNVDAAEGSDKDKQFIKAQALSYRAYSYMMLAQLYGNRWSDSNEGATSAVVLRLDESTGEIPTSTLKQVYDQIYVDLDDAIAMYTASGKKRAKNYEMDVNVAYAIYARAALNRQDYPNAEAFAIKARQGYALMSVTDYKAGFCNPNQEWIWGSYGAIDETLHFYSYFAYIAYSSSASAVKSYPKCISKEVYTKIPATDIRKGLFLDPTGYTYTASSGEANAAFTTYVRGIRPRLTSTSKVYAYMQFKIDANDNPGVGHLNHFRSSEMYLIEAEAKYFQNKSDQSVHEVLEALTKGSGRDPNYTSTKTGVDLLNEIKFYRAVELWGEGFDWFDMKRWGDPIIRKSPTNGGNFATSFAVTIQPQENNKWTWKIPLKETEYNDALK